jgi:hypothetical protein
MDEFLKISPLALWFLTGVISLLMAVKCLFSRKFLPFHEAAYGKPWDAIEEKLQSVILTLLKLSGLGFLVVAILLMTFPVYSYFRPGHFLKYVAPLTALIFCTGLFVVNYRLYKQTRANTPWKNSLFAMAVILLGILLSFL